MSLLSLFHSHTPPPSVGELIHWDESLLSVDNPVIDGEHRAIVECLNRVYADWMAADHRLNLEEELGKLSVVVETHFANEEDLMARRHCPTLPGHARDHRDMLAELHAIAKNVHALPQAKLEAQLLRFIRRLVMAHVLSWDMDARDYLRA